MATAIFSFSHAKSCVPLPGSGTIVTFKALETKEERAVFDLYLKETFQDLETKEEREECEGFGRLLFGKRHYLLLETKEEREEWIKTEREARVERIKAVIEERIKAVREEVDGFEREEALRKFIFFKILLALFISGYLVTSAVGKVDSKKVTTVSRMSRGSWMFMWTLITIHTALYKTATHTITA